MGTSEEVLLQAARRGDEDAYAQLVESRRPELQAHCYRMLGSVHDAEDALQEALLRAWRGLPRFEGRSSVRSWLYRIATNACLDALGRRPARMLPLDHGPAADPHDGPGRPMVESVWIEPFPDERLAARLEEGAPEARYGVRESVELAFVAALQHLPPRQRAVLILREVLGFSAAEVAAELGTTIASVNSALQRARASLDERVPDESQQTAARALGDAGLREVVDRYVAAWEAGDVDGVVGMLAEDVVITMPPMATWYAGRDAARVFLEQFAFARRWSRDREVFEAGVRDVRLVRTGANGQPALAAYNRDPEDGLLKPYALQVLSLRGGRISQVDGFVTPRFFPAFGLPDVLEEPAGP
jgi:RNA polymerase sigma-70 factor (ECF subfamily)